MTHNVLTAPIVDAAVSGGQQAGLARASDTIEVMASLRVYTQLGHYARRCAAAVWLTAPFAGANLPFLPSCVIAAIIYGHLGQIQTKHGRFSVSRAGIREPRGALLLPREACGMAFALEPRDGRAILCFTEGRQLVAELSLGDPSDAPRVLEAMGFARGALPLHVEGSLRPKFRAALGALGGTVAALSFFIGLKLGSYPLIMLSAFSLVHAVLAMLLRDVRVAGDGVWVNAPLSRNFIPFAELQGVSEAGLWLRLHTTRGDFSITPPLLWPGARSRAARDALVVALREGASRVASLPEPIPASRAGLALRPREGGFRELPMSADDLLRVVESARAPSGARARAAASLLRNEPESGHVERVRLAAEGSASPQLRRAFSCAIAHDDEAAMTEAIAAVEAEDAQATAGTRRRPSAPAE